MPTNIGSETRVEEVVTLFDDFSETFFADDAERVSKLATHPFYLCIQRRWIARRAGRADEYRLQAAQSRFALRLIAQPTLGFPIDGERFRLAGFISNHARNIASLVCRANRSAGDVNQDVQFLTNGDNDVGDVEWHDFISTLQERCHSKLDEDEHLVACFRWILRWSVRLTSTALGLSAAQEKSREASARHQIGPWIADYCGVSGR